MRPKGKLFALLTVFVAIGLVTASGAFTTVSAERTAEVNVAGDANALLGLDGGSENGDYVTQTDNTIEIDLSAPNSADGVNDNAVTEINYVLNITNNGGQSVDVWIDKNGSNSDLVTFHAGTVDDGTINSNGDAVTVNSGDTLEVSMKIDTTNSGFSSEQELLNDITIYANETSA